MLREKREILLSHRPSTFAKAVGSAMVSTILVSQLQNPLEATMSWKLILPALLALTALTAFSENASAQSLSVEYQVQIRVEHWRSGSGWWQTEYTTDNYQEALIIADLYEESLDNGTLWSELGLSWWFSPTDVRIKTVFPDQHTATGITWYTYTMPPKKVGYR